MSYNHLGDWFLYGEGAGFAPMVPTNGAADKSVDDSVDQVCIFNKFVGFLHVYFSYHFMWDVLQFGFWKS